MRRSLSPDVLITKEYAGQIAAQIRTARPELSSRVLESPKPDQMTHFTVVDAEGNVVSNTYTLQGSLGSLIVPKGTGVLLSGAAAYFDAGSGNQNDVGPRKRALFSMSPTLLLRADGRPWLAMGVAGSGRIPNILMQMIVNVVDLKLGVRDAVDAPRLHQELTAEALAEAGALSSDTIQELRRRGHQVTCRKSPLGDVHAVLIDEQRWRYGWSDGRSGGRALGY